MEEKCTDATKRPLFQQRMPTQEQDAVYPTIYSVIVYTRKKRRESFWQFQFTDNFEQIPRMLITKQT